MAPSYFVTCYNTLYNLPKEYIFLVSQLSDNHLKEVYIIKLRNKYIDGRNYLGMEFIIVI